MIRKIVNAGGIVLALLLIAATLGWLWLERSWSRWDRPEGPLAETGYQAFTHGAFGLEALPVKYAAVIDKVSAPAFTTTLEDGRSPWRTYGFITDESGKGGDSQLCQSNAENLLPHGFAVTNYLPQRAIQTPLKFAALTCASCHSGRLRTAEGLSETITGMGNPELDVIAFGDAVRNAVLDPSLTAGKIMDAYDQACPNDRTGFFTRQVEKLVMSAWLSGIRSQTGSETGKYGLPYHGAQMKDAADIPAGPGRTRPFRSIVRVALNLPGEENYAYSKIPAVFEQRRDLRPRAQYDGSVRNPVTRSFIAVYASGASVLALSKPEVAWDVRTAAAYTEELGLSIPVPSFAETFPKHLPDPTQVEAGFQVYKTWCADCHGYRPVGGGQWVAEGRWIHRFDYLDGRGGGPKLGVDPARVTFRYASLLPLSIWATLPGSGPAVAAQEQRLRDAGAAAEKAGEPALAWFWQQQLDGFLLAKRQYRLGHPLYFPACPSGQADCDETKLLASAPPCSEDDPQKCQLTDEVAYYNNPVPELYLRAPFLHNGSIPNARQLINLEPRPERFCRGENLYDPDALGFVATEPGPDGRCDDPRVAFLFDTTELGNSNRGHDFPPWDPKTLTDEQRSQLEALLAYLKTL
ncbi:hypothetical protein SAMN06265365_11795 [Tistlia consotensis]|uniref:Cytochrome c domain-containing protein n=1 Tax=Tistlia consotensis USBA 355 TaxID=560819 RepID=A0A1Y6C8C8_9PROT|nr:hypothetical protein [Tistlia consotensis]SMF51377.1 hypothetical protein SAMN05428998_11824 [Tistlia consotensis USBA 355]SNR84427.1 hypothetical protein SAMN06265365_11795 [Tistlia consotensis]